MKNRQDLLFLAGLFAFLLILVLWLRPGGKSSGRSFGASLPSVSSTETKSLDACPTAKCLTVYVAPWCRICRQSTGAIAALGKHLKERGVDTRIVVGDGSPEDIRAYAQELGPGTLMDLDNQVPVSGGVPNFIVSDSAGKILYAIPGVPGIYQPPFSEQVLQEFAAFLSLP